VDRALALHKNAAQWKKMMRAGMRQNFTWRHSAAEYLRLYELAAHDRQTPSRKQRAPGKTGK
jgi:starch synthase